MKINIKPLLTVVSIVFVSGLMLSNNTMPTKKTEYSKIDSFNLSKGKIVFYENCTGCHGLNAQGGFGPNLTDNYYLHGHHTHNVIHIIKHGNSSKGMTAFGRQLSHAQIRDVAHYVMSLKNSNPPGAKEPQGKLHK